MKIRIERKGAFQALNFQPNMQQCGSKRNDAQYWYTVVIEIDSASLDSRGFIIDNNEVQGYFIRTYEWEGSGLQDAVSCEVIAWRAAKAFKVAVPGATKVAVTIYNSEERVVGLTAEWEAEEVEYHIEHNIDPDFNFDSSEGV